MNIYQLKNININEEEGDKMWWIIGIIGYACILLFAWSLCAIASKADEEMMRLYNEEREEGFYVEKN